MHQAGFEAERGKFTFTKGQAEKEQPGRWERIQARRYPWKQREERSQGEERHRIRDGHRTEKGSTKRTSLELVRIRESSVTVAAAACSVLTDKNVSDVRCLPLLCKPHCLLSRAKGPN